MRPTWIIQTDVSGINTALIADEVARQGMDAISVEFDYNKLQGTGLPSGVYDMCGLFYGSLDFVKYGHVSPSFFPGAWCDLGNLACSTYYAYYSEYLLNRDYTMLPFGSLLERYDHLFRQEVFKNGMFIRPDSGGKPFTGFVARSCDHSLLEELEHNVHESSLVVIAPSTRIDTEHRFVVCDKKVVAGCTYLPTESEHYPPQALCLASEIASLDWQPEICYTIDIAATNGLYRLLEINSFSCAGFYACDLSEIVRHASLAAVADWEDAGA